MQNIGFIISMENVDKERTKEWRMNWWENVWTIEDDIIEDEIIFKGLLKLLWKSCRVRKVHHESRCKKLWEEPENRFGLVYYPQFHLNIHDSEILLQEFLGCVGYYLLWFQMVLKQQQMFCPFCI